MTSVTQETAAGDAAPTPADVGTSMARHFADAFERSPREIEPAALEELAPAQPSPA
jgi:hypothetical protein